ncbi:hypothetical_protein_-_uncharacterised_function [Leishmania infantum]|uniref:Hypothetical_protein_-_uncharacterized_function n=1 Tax=Leishmania infantum TaxID=5671 RepID=A0A6L0XHJ8_LEIIN|nr:hypothetical_protein_-_uncharacterised_function [Leishmania infantum]SUZ43070.1 hypothetical_protein_-_uncharacterised_function [Leishmania infantum]
MEGPSRAGPFRANGARSKRRRGHKSAAGKRCAFPSPKTASLSSWGWTPSAAPRPTSSACQGMSAPTRPRRRSSSPVFISPASLPGAIERLATLMR